MPRVRRSALSVLDLCSPNVLSETPLRAQSLNSKVGPECVRAALILLCQCGEVFEEDRSRLTYVWSTTRRREQLSILDMGTGGGESLTRSIMEQERALGRRIRPLTQAVGQGHSAQLASFAALSRGSGMGVT